MKHPSQHFLDASKFLLSPFDLSGSIILDDDLLQTKDINHDLNQILNDLNKLEKDYTHAHDNTLKKVPHDQE